MGQEYSIPGVAQFQATGVKNFTAKGFRKHSKLWCPQDLEVDLNGKIYIVTGANSGIGFAASKEFAKRNGTVLMLCRDAERGQAAVKKVQDETGNQNIFLHLVDVSRPLEIHQFSKIFTASYPRLDCLVNNAGSLDHERVETPDKLEATFASHVLGSFLLTETLLPVLQKSSPSRVVTVTSGGMYSFKMDVHNFQSDQGHYNGYSAYGRAKRCQVYLTQYWARKYSDTGVTFNALHPGWAQTPGVDKSLPKWFQKLELRTPEQGADTLVWLAISPTVEKATGQLWFDRVPAQVDMHLANTKASQEEIENLYQYCSTFLKAE